MSTDHPKMLSQQDSKRDGRMASSECQDSSDIAELSVWRNKRLSTEESTTAAKSKSIASIGNGSVLQSQNRQAIESRLAGSSFFDDLKQRHSIQVEWFVSPRTDAGSRLAESPITPGEDCEQSEPSVPSPVVALATYRD